MRVFRVEQNGQFREYVETPFHADHEEIVLESWLEANPDSIVEDGRLLIIGRQVPTNLGGFIDLLALDRRGDVAVLELKRNRTPRDTLAQALEYASFAERIDSEQLETIFTSYLDDRDLELANYHREYFGLQPSEPVVFNKDQRIVIIGQHVTHSVRQTASFLRSKGIRATCVEFSFFQTEDGKQLLTQDIVVGREPLMTKSISSTSLPPVSRSEFLASLNEHGRTVFEQLLNLADQRSMPIRWGTKGFSLNASVDGVNVVICFGYPPHSVYRQSIYTALFSPGGIGVKTTASDQVIRSLWSEAESTGLFSQAGRELKCPLDRPFTHPEVEAVLSWCLSVERAITSHGLKN